MTRAYTASTNIKEGMLLTTSQTQREISYKANEVVPKNNGNSQTAYLMNNVP